MFSKIQFNKKRAAFEWILFLCFAVFGFAVAPLVFYFLKYRGEYALGEMYGELHKMFFDMSTEVFLFFLTPYVVLQLVRLTIWACKQRKSKWYVAEWLYLLFGFLFGLFTMPPYFNAHVARRSVELMEFYRDVFTDYLNLHVADLLYILIPYAVIQAIRITIWSIKTLRAKKK